MHAIDQITTELADRGWSLGDGAYWEGEAAIWQVYFHRDGQNVVARDPDQTTAWRLAAEQIVELRRLEFMERLAAIEHTLQAEPAESERCQLLEESDVLEFELGRDYIFKRNWLEHSPPV